MTTLLLAALCSAAEPEIHQFTAVKAVEVDLDARAPRWSPTGEHIAFHTDAGTETQAWLWSRGPAAKVALPGGSLRLDGSSITWLGWVATDGTEVLVHDGAHRGGRSRLYFTTPEAQVSAELLSASVLPGDLSFPALTPDDAFLVCSDEGKADLCVWNRVTHVVRRLTDDGVPKARLAVLPDGSRIAFERHDADGADVYELDVSKAVGPPPPPPADPGTAATRKKKKKKAGEPEATAPSPPVQWAAPERLVAKGPGDQARPAFVEGGVVYLSSDRDGVKHDIVYSPRDGAPTVLAEGVREPWGAIGTSSDGSWVAWTHDNDDGIYLAHPDGSRRIKIPTGLENVGDPALYSSSGQLKIAFVGQLLGADDKVPLYWMDAREILAAPPAP